MSFLCRQRHSKYRHWNNIYTVKNEILRAYKSRIMWCSNNSYLSVGFSRWNFNGTSSNYKYCVWRGTAEHKNCIFSLSSLTINVVIAAHKLISVVRFRVPKIYSSSGYEYTTCCVYDIHVRHVQLPLIYTDRRGRVGNTLIMCSGGPGFKSRPGETVYADWVLSWFSRPFRQMPEYDLTQSPYTI
jgi:hypothetical protein